VHPTAKTYLEQLDRIPPNVCRLLARSRGRNARPLTVREIALAAGFTWQKAAWIARKKTWADVAVADADRFRAACGVRIRDEHRQLALLARGMSQDGVFQFWDHVERIKTHDKKRVVAIMLKNLA